MNRKKHKKTRLALIFLEVFTFVLAVGLGGIFLLAGQKQRGETEAAKSPVPTETKVEIKESISKPVEENNISEDDGESGGKYDTLLNDAEEMERQRIYLKKTNSSEYVTLLFAGDVGLAEGYAILGNLLSRGGNIEQGFDANTLLAMRSADIFMVNNEFTYTNRGVPTEGKQYIFRSNPENVKYLLDMGVDVVSIANNHTYDYGEISLTDTIDTLRNANMPYVGAGYNIEEAVKPVYFIANDLRIAIVSATQIERVSNPDTKGATANSPGVFRCFNNDRICEVIKEAKECSDYVVAYIHWGTELEPNIDWAQEALAPKLVEAGADLIIGAHPHILQKIDYIGDTPIIYSLGNYWFNSKTMDTGLFEVVLDKDGNNDSIRFIPAIQSDSRVKIISGSEQARILGHMQSLSGRVNIDAEGYVSKR